MTISTFTASTTAILCAFLLVTGAFSATENVFFPPFLHLSLRQDINPDYVAITSIDLNNEGKICIKRTPHKAMIMSSFPPCYGIIGALSSDNVPAVLLLATKIKLVSSAYQIYTVSEIFPHFIDSSLITIPELRDYLNIALAEIVILKRLAFSLLVDLTNFELTPVKQDYSGYRTEYLSNFRSLLLLQSGFCDQFQLLRSNWLLKCIEGDLQFLCHSKPFHIEMLLINRRKPDSQEFLHRINANDSKAPNFIESFLYITVESEESEKRRFSYMAIRGLPPLTWKYPLGLSWCLPFPFITSKMETLIDSMNYLYQEYLSMNKDLTALHIVDLSETTLSLLESVIHRHLSISIKDGINSGTLPNIQYSNFGSKFACELSPVYKAFVNSLLSDYDPSASQYRLFRISDIECHDRSNLFLTELHLAVANKVWAYLGISNEQSIALQKAFAALLTESSHHLSLYENGSLSYHQTFSSISPPMSFYSFSLLKNLPQCIVRRIWRLETYFFPYYNSNVLAWYSGNSIKGVSFVMEYCYRRGFWWGLTLYAAFFLGDAMYYPTYDNRYAAGWGTWEPLVPIPFILLLLDAAQWYFNPIWKYSLVKLFN